MSTYRGHRGTAGRRRVAHLRPAQLPPVGRSAVQRVRGTWQQEAADLHFEWPRDVVGRARRGVCGRPIVFRDQHTSRRAGLQRAAPEGADSARVPSSAPVRVWSLGLSERWTGRDVRREGRSGCARARMVQSVHPTSVVCPSGPRGVARAAMGARSLLFRL